MENKTFSIMKVGYTAGVYGCSGEYFTLILPNDQINFSGMYGAEERICRTLKDAGWVEHYISSSFGRMTLKETRGRFLSETQAIEKVKEYIAKN